MPNPADRASLPDRCGCREFCGDDGDIDGPGTCAGLPIYHEPLVEIVVVRREALSGGDA
jgi:hypothetical protein